MDNDFTNMYYSDCRIVSAESTTDGQMEIVKRYPSNAAYASIGCGAVPDRVTKEIYDVVEGKIELIKTIKGTHTPGYDVAESIEFPEEE